MSVFKNPERFDKAGVPRPRAVEAAPVEKAPAKRADQLKTGDIVMRNGVPVEITLARSDSQGVALSFVGEATPTIFDKDEELEVPPASH